MSQSSSNTARDLRSLGLAAHVLETLADAGVNSLTDWRNLTPARRKAIFGITPRLRELLDGLAKEART